MRDSVPPARDAAPPDTLRHTATAGTPFITMLPDALDSGAIARYNLLRGPALSGVKGRSLTWVLRPSDAGTTQHLVLRAHHPPADSLAPDTLVVRINVSS